MKIKSILILVLVAGLLLGACNTVEQDKVSQPTVQEIPIEARVENNENQSSNGNSSTGPEAESHTETLTALTDGEVSSAEIEGLLFMREEEKLARDVYQQMADLWGMNIFSNIARSEQSHMDSVLSLIDLFGAVDPVGDQALGEFANQDLQALYNDLVSQGGLSVEESLLVGGAIEEIDILDLQQYLAGTTDGAIIEVYQNLLRGSINHLASFVRTYERQTGETYQPQFMSLEEYQDLISQSSFNGNGGGGRGMNASSKGKGQARQ